MAMLNVHDLPQSFKNSTVISKLLVNCRHGRALVFLRRRLMHLRDMENGQGLPCSVMQTEAFSTETIAIQNKKHTCLIEPWLYCDTSSTDGHAVHRTWHQCPQAQHQPLPAMIKVERSSWKENVLARNLTLSLVLFVLLLTPCAMCTIISGPDEPISTDKDEFPKGREGMEMDMIEKGKLLEIQLNQHHQR